MSETSPNVTRPSAPPPDRGGARLTFFDLAAKKGAFMFEPEEGAAPVPTSFVMGYYVQHWLEWDPGRPDAEKEKDRIPARWKLRVILRDAECERGRVGYAWVTISAKSAFYGAALGLIQCDPENFIGFKAVPGDDACFVNVDHWDGTAWSSKLTPKNDGRPFEVRYDEAVAAVRDAPGYHQYEKKEKAEQVTPLQTSAAPASSNAAPATGEEGGRRRRSAAAPEAAGGVDRLTGLPPGTPPADKQAFGVTPGRWPLAEDWDKDPNPNVLLAIRKKIAELDTDFDDPAPLDEVFKLGRSLFDAYGLQRSAVLSRGRAMLLYDFLTYAATESIDQLWDATYSAEEPAETPNRPAAPAADEYDPFADE